ncbi:MAG TPA: alpha/beta hydrolase [Acidimicrobiales bacterium]
MITTSAGDVAVHTTGSGPPLVLLHANGSDHRDYEAVLPALRSHWTVHQVDWPGHGTSGQATDPTACGFAEALPDVLLALGDVPAVVVGNSVGGFAALRTAARRPELVRALVLVDPGGFTPRWIGTTLACRAIGTAPLARRAYTFLPPVSLRHRNEWTARAIGRSRQGACDPDRIALFASVWRSFADPDHDARPDASSITAPTLLVWGTQDPVLPWAVDGRRARRALPGAEVATLRCGHQPFIERPEEFLAVVDRFLAPILADTPERLR